MLKSLPRGRVRVALAVLIVVVVALSAPSLDDTARAAPVAHDRVQIDKHDPQRSACPWNGRSYRKTVMWESMFKQRLRELRGNTEFHGKADTPRLDEAVIWLIYRRIERRPDCRKVIIHDIPELDREISRAEAFGEMMKTHVELAEEFELETMPPIAFVLSVAKCEGAEACMTWSINRRTEATSDYQMHLPARLPRYAWIHEFSHYTHSFSVARGGHGADWLGHQLRILNHLGYFDAEQCKWVNYAGIDTPQCRGWGSW